MTVGNRVEENRKLFLGVLHFRRLMDSPEGSWVYMTVEIKGEDTAGENIWRS